nr:translation initiation factor IF-2-like [Aegilops tauschii subsp. strangulata]
MMDLEIRSPRLWPAISGEDDHHVHQSHHVGHASPPAPPWCLEADKPRRTPRLASSHGPDPSTTRSRSDRGRGPQAATAAEAAPLDSAQPSSPPYDRIIAGAPRATPPSRRRDNSRHRQRSRSRRASKGPQAAAAPLPGRSAATQHALLRAAGPRPAQRRLAPRRPAPDANRKERGKIPAATNAGRTLPGGAARWRRGERSTREDEGRRARVSPKDARGSGSGVTG